MVLNYDIYLLRRGYPSLASLLVVFYLILANVQIFQGVARMAMTRVRRGVWQLARVEGYESGLAYIVADIQLLYEYVSMNPSAFVRLY